MYVIEISIENENELFNRFDRSHRTLSGDVLSYLKNSFKQKPLHEKAMIRISSPGSVQEDVITGAFQHQLQLELAENRREQRINRIRILRLFAIGVLLIAAGIILSVRLKVIALEVISIVGSMAIKDGGTILIEHNPELRVQERFLQKMMDTEIEYCTCTEGD